MRKVLTTTIFIGLALLISSCGHQQATTTVASPLSCKVTAIDGGSQITCPDGSTQIVYNGADGHTGLTGAVGPSGQAAKPCTVTDEVGGALVSCPDGSSQMITDGSNGIQGQPGSPGTIVTSVQFCASYAASYPNAFPETAICLNENLYAVYWDSRNAWFALIPPGYYSSTSTSAPCRFIVTANCQVTQQ